MMDSGLNVLKFRRKAGTGFKNGFILAINGIGIRLSAGISIDVVWRSGLDVTVGLRFVEVWAENSLESNGRLSNVEIITLSLQPLQPT